MYQLLSRNYSKIPSSKYIPSKNKTWCYKKGYYKTNNANRSYVSKNLSKSIQNYYNNKYIYRLK